MTIGVSKLPLYGIDELNEKPQAKVIVTEGEKACDAARRLLPQCVAVTTPHGAQNVGEADWSTLAGRQVVIWRKVGDAGQSFVDAVFMALKDVIDVSQMMRIVPKSKEFPIGWDAAVAEASGWKTTDATAFLNRSLAPKTKPPRSSEPFWDLLEATAWISKRDKEAVNTAHNHGFDDAALKEIWDKLKQGDLKATGLMLKNGTYAEIPAHQWQHYHAIAEQKSFVGHSFLGAPDPFYVDVISYGRYPDGELNSFYTIRADNVFKGQSHRRILNITVASDDVRKLWPAKRGRRVSSTDQKKIAAFIKKHVDASLNKRTHSRADMLKMVNKSLALSLTIKSLVFCRGWKEATLSAPAWCRGGAPLKKQRKPA